MRINMLIMLAVAVFLGSCNKDTTKNCDTNPSADCPQLIFKLKFDPTQQRLNELGQPASMPAGHAAQHPDFKGLSAHFIELVPNEFTAIKAGEVVYMGAETDAGGATAIDFDQAIVKADGEIFFQLPLAQVQAGNYNFARVSVSYQNYEVDFNIKNIPLPTGNMDLNDQKGQVASFVGYNTYITNITPDQITETVNDDKLQGYWAFETKLNNGFENYNDIYTGEASGTTVVNPLSSTTPIPAGSCIVTGAMNQTLEITGDETEDIVVTLSFSVNNSFEWVDTNGNGELDFDMSSTNEEIVDMGLRGLKVLVE